MLEPDTARHGRHWVKPIPQPTADSWATSKCAHPPPSKSSVLRPGDLDDVRGGGDEVVLHAVVFE